MPAYFDTGTLVPLYVKEAFTPAVTFFVDGRSEFIPIHLFLRHAFRHARNPPTRADTFHDQGVVWQVRSQQLPSRNRLLTKIRRAFRFR